MTLDLEDLQRKAEAAKEANKTHTGLYPAGVWHVVEYGDEQSPGICVHSGDAWRVCFMATIQNQKDFDQQMAKAQHIATFNPATVLELIAEVERLRANAEKMEKLYRGLSVERGDLQTEFIEMRSERDALKAQRDEMAEALGECEEVLALSEHTPLRDPAYHDRVKALGREIGFGAMMAIAERAWREVLEEKGYPVGSEHTAGACRSTVDATLRRAREALRNARTGEDHD